MSDDLKRQMIEELNQIIDSREEEVGRVYPQVRDAYLTPYEWPELDTLRHEVCIALTFGLHQAALTLMNHMLESFLKFSISYKEAFESYEASDDRGLDAMLASLAPSFERNDGKDMGNTINRACTLGLIEKHHKKQLHEFRESLRNAYSHAERRKIHGDVATSVQPVHLSDSGEFVVEGKQSRRIVDMPFAHGLAQYEHAKANALPYFLYVDALVRHTRPIVFPNSAPQDPAA